MKNVLEKTIKSLSKHEVINYKLYANRHKKTINRKDIALFDEIKKNKKEDISKNNIKALPTVKKAVKANTARKLQVRLLEEIGNSLVQFYFHENSETFIYNELNLHDIFYEKREWQVAFFHLERAEKKAKQIQHFKMLSVIYDKYIKLAVYYGDIIPKDYINKRKENEKFIYETQLFDDAINSIQYELQRNFGLITTQKKLTDTLQNTINNLGQKKEYKNNFNFKIKLFEAVCKLLIAKQDFKILENYTITEYKKFSSLNFYNKETHDVKLRTLCYICNSLFQNQKYKEALIYLNELSLELKSFGGFLHDKYVFFYYNSLANNYTVVNQNKAVEILHEAEKVPAIANNEHHLSYIYWNLAGAYFDTKSFKLSLKNILLIKSLSEFDNLNDSLKLHISIFEIVLRIELNQNDFILKLINALVKYYSEILNQKPHQKDFDFINLLKKYTSFDKSNSTFKKHARDFIEKQYVDQNNNVLDYNKWLVEKFL